jgi:hypothetical protein
MAQRLSEPLPLTVAAVAPVIEQKPTQMSDEALWEAMKAPVATASAPAPAPAPEPVAPNGFPTLEPLTTQSGLTKRVRGAQMPELGSNPIEDTPPRPADEVRSTLASLQRGVDLGRQRQGDS